MANMHLVTGYAGKLHVTAADQGSLHAALFGNGSFVLDRGNKLAATVVTNNKISIADGDIIMQGRHGRIETGLTVDMAIDNGAAGYHRNDLIVARYTKNSGTGVEEINLVVIKGTATTGTAADPAYTKGDILSGATQADFPLYRVPIVGLNVQKLVPLYEMFGAIADKVPLTGGDMTGALGVPQLKIRSVGGEVPAVDMYSEDGKHIGRVACRTDDHRICFAQWDAGSDYAEWFSLPASSGLTETTQTKIMTARGGTFTGTAVAAASTNESSAKIHNIIVVDAGTDLASLSVPAGTIVMVKK